MTTHDPFRRLRTSSGTWRIAALLNTGVQRFDDLSDDELALLGLDLNPKDLPIPVVVTSDGILIDGHQRLRLLLERGHKVVGADSVRIFAKAHKDNAVLWSVRFNKNRRHLSLENKARAARELMREQGWSQGLVAEEFGVSAAAVSQWLSSVPADADDLTPTFTIGRDGRMRDTSGIVDTQRGRRPGPDTEHPDPLAAVRRAWSGPAARLPKALDKLAKDLEACPPSRALVMLHRSDVASIRHRLLECIQVLEDAVAGLDDDHSDRDDDEEVSY
jgi:hypothetical protein